jgi:hypothetical protein
VTTPLPIQPRPPIRGGLDSVAIPLPLSESEWSGGVFVTSTDDSSVVVWDASCQDYGWELGAAIVDPGDPPNDPIEEKPASTPPAESEFAPTVIAARASCSVGGSQSAIGDIIGQNAQAALDRMQYRVLAQALHGGTPVYAQQDHGGGQNPNLAGFGGGTAPTYPAGFNASAPGNIRGTLQGLLDLVCECYHSDPVFHIPRSFMAYFLTDALVRWDEGTQTFRFGPHMVSFDCYANKGSNELETATPTATDGSEVWIWTSAQPMVALGAQDTITNLERRQNSYTALVERQAIVAFDTACFGAAKATIL